MSIFDHLYFDHCLCLDWINTQCEKNMGRSFSNTETYTQLCSPHGHISTPAPPKICFELEIASSLANKWATQTNVTTFSRVGVNRGQVVQSCVFNLFYSFNRRSRSFIIYAKHHWNCFAICHQMLTAVGTCKSWWQSKFSNNAFRSGCRNGREWGPTTCALSVLKMIRLRMLRVNVKKGTSSFVLVFFAAVVVVVVGGGVQEPDPPLPFTFGCNQWTRNPLRKIDVFLRCWIIQHNSLANVPDWQQFWALLIISRVRFDHKFFFESALLFPDATKNARIHPKARKLMSDSGRKNHAAFACCMSVVFFEIVVTIWSSATWQKNFLVFPKTEKGHQIVLDA